MRYFVEKKKYSTQNVDHIYIVFQNGNYLSIEKNELIDINVNLYDRLTRYEYSASFVGHSGYVKLKISSEKKTYSDDDDCTGFLYNHDVYKENRKSYIENRCTKENDINYVIFFDDNRWNDMIFGDIRCRMEGEFLVLQFEQNQKYGAVGADTAYIDMPDVSKKDILKINLVFENCESVMIYQDEIREISLTFENQLKWAGGNFCRRYEREGITGILHPDQSRFRLFRKLYFLGHDNRSRFFLCSLALSLDRATPSPSLAFRPARSQLCVYAMDIRDFQQYCLQPLIQGAFCVRTMIAQRQQ